MTIFEQLKSDLMVAMKSGETLKRDTLRALITAIKNEAIAQKKDVTDITSDEITTILKRAKKQRDDASAQFISGNRKELAQKESAEGQIISTYLPEQMSEDAIIAIVDAVIADIGTENFGAVMGQVMARTKGRADGAIVKQIVDLKIKA